MDFEQVLRLKEVVETGDDTYYHGCARDDLLTALDRLEDLEEWITEIKSIICRAV